MVETKAIDYAGHARSRVSHNGTISCVFFGIAVVIFGFSLYCAWPALVRDDVYRGGLSGGPAGAFAWTVIASLLAAAGVGVGVSGIGSKLDECRSAILGTVLNAPLAVFGLVVVVMGTVGILGIGPY